VIEFKDVNGTEIKLGDYIYHAVSGYGNRAWQRRLVVVGFTNTMMRVVEPERKRKYDHVQGTWEVLPGWVEPRTIRPGDRVVVVNTPWPEAEEYLRDHNMLHLRR